MTNIFGKEFQPTYAGATRTWQGRSKKKLRPVVKHDGRVFVARYEGRPSISFGATEKEALNNLYGGVQQ